MNFEEFIATVDFKFNDGIYKNKLRYGQSIMNELWVVDPEKYKKITQTDYERVEIFLKRFSFCVVL
jgi:hypothetical protein